MARRGLARVDTDLRGLARGVLDLGMADYFWSARFIHGVLTLVLGVALLIGALLYLPLGGPEARYELFVGAALCLCGPLLALRARAGLLAYLALLLAALALSLASVGLDVWALLPRLAAPLLWGAVLFSLRHRIAPTRDPSGSPAARLRRAGHEAQSLLREHS